MLPEGWEASTVGEHTEVLTGFAFKSGEYISSDDGIKLLRGDNVGQGKLRWRDVKRYPRAKTAALTRYQLQAGDFVIAMDRTWIPAGVKISEVLAEDLPCLLVQRVARLRSKSSLRQDLLRQFFAGSRFEQFVKGAQTETAVPHISPNDVKNFAIAVPPLPEQQKIAEILSTWDRAITTTEQRIANARDQKRALMQQLLTGTLRLPGFSGEWTACTLEELFHFRKGQGLSKGALVSSGTNRCVLYGELYTRYPEVISEVVSRTDDSDGFPSRTGDILIPASTTTSAVDLANATALLEAGVLLGGDINVLRPKHPGTSAPFFAYLLTHAKRSEIAARAQGTTIIHLYGSDLKPMKISLPNAAEQSAIADVIQIADAEITTHVAALAGLRQEKAALMQQLLTGKRRVQIGAPAPLTEAAA